MNIKNCCTRYTTVESLRGRLAVERALGKKIGFLATMGALHEGHLTLARDLREHADIVVASVFVNPTQFNDKKDYEAYLINIDADHAALEEQGVEILFAPAVDEIYPSGFQTTLKPGALTQRWEGEFRPGHFAGMATVVAILLSIVSPDVSIFGEKDFQQLRIVEQMVKDLRFPVKILRGRLVREESGLAMSSRNVRLTPENRSAAAAISRGLLSAKSLAANGVVEVSELLAAARSQILQIPEHEIDYLTVVDEDTLEPISVVTSAARLLTVVRVQGVRLLDNIAL
jgi:pantoate--beta-alanine ligase